MKDYIEITKNVYNMTAKEYKKAVHNDYMRYDLKLKKLLGFMRRKDLKGLKFIEIGFGSRRDIKYFIDNGLEKSNYLGLDISE